jgi:hypothetical protein
MSCNKKPTTNSTAPAAIASSYSVGLHGLHTASLVDSVIKNALFFCVYASWVCASSLETWQVSQTCQVYHQADWPGFATACREGRGLGKVAQKGPGRLTTGQRVKWYSASRYR